MLKGRLMTCPGPVKLVVHDPMPTEGLEPTVEAARRLAEQVKQTIETALA
jgi:hypothetical protein